MNTKRLLNMAAMLVLVTGFLLAFTEGGALAVQKYLQPKNAFADGTKIGDIDVSGKTKNEAHNELLKAAEDWRASSSLEFRLAEATQPADVTALSFAIAKSVQDAEPGKSNPVGIELNEDETEEMVFSLYPGVDPALYDMTALKDTIIEKAGHLDKPLQETINLGDYALSEGGDEPVAEAFSTGMDMTPGVSALIGALKEVPIEGKSTFSLLQFAADLGMDELVAEDSSMVASLLYELLFRTNFTIMERNQSSELPEYAQLGLEAKVDSGSNLDFIFANPNDTAYSLSLVEEDGGVRAVLVGTPFVYEYDLSLRNIESFPPKTIQQFNPALSKGETRVVEKGKDGLLASAYRLKKNHEGEVLEEEKIAEDFYPPIHRVEMRSLIVKESGQTEQDPIRIDGEEIRGEEQGSSTSGSGVDTGNSGETGSNGKKEEGSGSAPSSGGNKTDSSSVKDEEKTSGGGKGNSASGGNQAGQSGSGTAVPGQVWTDPGDVQK